MGKHVVWITCSCSSRQYVITLNTVRDRSNLFRSKKEDMEMEMGSGGATINNYINGCI